MSNQIPNISEIIRLLPQPLRTRFNSLGNYVKTVFEGQGKNRLRKSKLTDEDIRFVQLAAFIYSINFFLREGTKAAQTAAETLEKLQVKNANIRIEGFNVGSTIFKKDNENTLLGRTLAESLMQSLAGTPLLKHIEQATSMSNLIKNLRDEMTRGQRMD